jgi:hypothetical protein
MDIVAYSPFSVRPGIWILRLSDADDQHHLIVSPDEIAIQLLGLRVDWATTVIKLLWWFPMIMFTLTVESLVVGRATLVSVSQIELVWLRQTVNIPTPGLLGVLEYP